jgi:hypothetical protein
MWCRGSERSPRYLTPGVIVASGFVAWSTPASAYRPFDGTDAAVVGLNESEVELQPFGAERIGSQTTAIAPFVVYNYGFADRWEAVLQTEMQSPITGSGELNVQATGAFLKYVIRPGVLQGQSGVSIATEFGPLLPGINADQGVGFSWAGIVSQRWDWGTAHFNIETNLTRDRSGRSTRISRSTPHTAMRLRTAMPSTKSAPASRSRSRRKATRRR